MQSQDVAPRPASSRAQESVVDVEQAEAALVEHYPRLVRLAYLTLPSSLGRNRRVLTAHALTQRALPRGRRSATLIPAQATGTGAVAGRERNPGYALVRVRVVRTALEAGLPLRRRAWPKRSQLPPLLPHVWGLRLFPRSGGADELALDQRLSALTSPARAAYVLRGLEKLPDPAIRALLEEAGVDDPAAALKEAGSVPAQQYALLSSPEYDPCSLHARPTDLMRRRQHLKAALAATAAVVVCGALLGLPGESWGPDGAAAPPYARNPAAQAALDPGRLTTATATAWQTTGRSDFTTWPARGDLVKDKALLRRALAVWARPGESVQVAVTLGTQAGPPPGPPQLLYAGKVDNLRVVLLHDGLRIARYAEPLDDPGVAALDLTRVDGATGAGASALVLGRADGNVRYLTAPWVRGAAVRDLAKPDAAVRRLALTKDGTTAPFAGPAVRTGKCRSWDVLQLTDATGGTRLLTDLLEVAPAHLTVGRPSTASPGRDASVAPAVWAPFACSLAAVRSQGVRSVNAWQFARQPLPDGSGRADWVCTRSETWRGAGTRALAQFNTAAGAYVTAAADEVPACGPADPHVLAAGPWKSATGDSYLLAAGSRGTVFVELSGGVSGSARGNLLAVPAEEGAQAELRGTLANGREIGGLQSAG
ncbi:MULTISPECIES: hypothetical protein [Streptomyces]|uniref:hypothetical protein n=1 Tax=Streptomyces TaxID=1883 RepID=UPI000A399879|nr:MULTISPECIES: hypothetical protein [Streptomyces]MDX3615561.1 hypothetical protein [Streptomyces europaeiscabiei]MDX3636313.1 hypothetical protein [Streptomyces europaeiscabiei]MDX3647541.1 hypothetical protein [Streptomyces europaeiscabiei]WUD38332.1 hypothetical protein OG858_12840 [Streptomyces europaeiscabiei]